MDERRLVGEWIDRYSRRGYRVIASGTSYLGTGQIVDHCDAIISGLDRPPIVMGHALGGAIAEILLDRGLGAAGVAIDAVAVRGILATSGSADRAPCCTSRALSSGPGGRRSPALPCAGRSRTAPGMPVRCLR